MTWTAFLLQPKSATRLFGWAAENLKGCTAYTPAEYHTTVSYDVRPNGDWNPSEAYIKAGDSTGDRHPPIVPTKWGIFGNHLVLRFESPTLAALWSLGRQEGVVGSHEVFDPHITVAKDLSDDLASQVRDMKLPLPDFPLYLNAKMVIVRGTKFNVPRLYLPADDEMPFVTLTASVMSPSVDSMLVEAAHPIDGLTIGDEIAFTPRMPNGVSNISLIGNYLGKHRAWVPIKKEIMEVFALVRVIRKAEELASDFLGRVRRMAELVTDAAPPPLTGVDIDSSMQRLGFDRERDSEATIYFKDLRGLNPPKLKWCDELITSFLHRGFVYDGEEESLRKNPSGIVKISNGRDRLSFGLYRDEAKTFFSVRREGVQ